MHFFLLRYEELFLYKFNLTDYLKFLKVFNILQLWMHYLTKLLKSIDPLNYGYYKLFISCFEKYVIATLGDSRDVHQTFGFGLIRTEIPKR